jgi:hypothetical protein
MADQTTPDTTNQQWFLNPANISQAPFLQSWNGIQAPFANQQDQIQQALQISGVYPGQMPDNTFLGNTAARYAFGRTLPGSSPYQGALTSYMQGKGMPTGVPLGLLGLQNGIGIWDPPSGSPPFPGGSSPGNYPAPGQGNPVPGQPAPPFPPISDPSLPGARPPGPGVGGPLPPSPLGGVGSRASYIPPNIAAQLQSGRGAWTANHGLLGSIAPQIGAARVQALHQAGTQALQGVTDPATRYMMDVAYGLPFTGFSNQQINQYEQSTMGSTYNKKTGQVQRNY